MFVGIKVMLCGECMYVFFEKLINIGLFCICDFCGINFNVFDGCGNYNFGIKEQLIFFEIIYDMVDKIRGMDIIIVIIVKIDEEVCVLFQLMGLFFCKQ